jgi:hypothetical protein
MSLLNYKKFTLYLLLTKIPLINKNKNKNAEIGVARPSHPFFYKGYILNFWYWGVEDIEAIFSLRGHYKLGVSWRKTYVLFPIILNGMY